MKLLSGNVVNADDYGMSASKNKAILFCSQHGMISSTSISVVNGITLEDVKLIKLNPGLKLGLHINLTEGTSSCETSYRPAISQLADVSEACFEFEMEMEYQLKKFQDLFKLLPDFIDSHQHFCYLSPGAFSAMLKLSMKYQLPMRSALPFVTGSRLDSFVRKVEGTYGIQVPFEPFARARSLKQILDSNHINFRTTDVLLDFKHSLELKTMSGYEIVCHPEFV